MFAGSAADDTTRRQLALQASRHPIRPDAAAAYPPARPAPRVSRRTDERHPPRPHAGHVSAAAMARLARREPVGRRARRLLRRLAGPGARGVRAARTVGPDRGRSGAATSARRGRRRRAVRSVRAAARRLRARHAGRPLAPVATARLRLPQSRRAPSGARERVHGAAADRRGARRPRTRAGAGAGLGGGALRARQAVAARRTTPSARPPRLPRPGA